MQLLLEIYRRQLESRIGRYSKGKLTKLPATMSVAEEIYLMSREQVFIADDLHLKKMFSSSDVVPLFVWFPKSNSSFSVPARRLNAVYVSLGVRKISESVKCDVGGLLSQEHWEKVDPRNGLIGRGLIKIILGFLAGPQVNMPLEERHKAAKSIAGLSVHESVKPIQVSYRIMPSASASVEVKKLKLVLWEKSYQLLLIDKSGYEDGKVDLELVISFAEELAQGLLAQVRPSAAEILSKTIQMGFMFDFNENEVDYLLMKENLELFVEDEQFLDVAFLLPAGEPTRVYQRRSCRKSLKQGLPTPIASCKKPRQG